MADSDSGSEDEVEING